MKEKASSSRTLKRVMHVNPVGVYLDVTAGNVANLLFPFGVS